jgi:histidinol phosphatase-like PHP family hydrolase
MIYSLKEPHANVEQKTWALFPAATMIFGLNTYTNYSDGKLSLYELTELAYFIGCESIAIIKHSGIKGSLSVEKFQKIEKLRTNYPGLLIFGGLELGMPFHPMRTESM